MFQGLRPALAGVVCGLVAAFGLTRFIAGFLFEVKAWDTLVFLVIPAILVGVALVAVWLPAMRASRIDPIDALRYEWVGVIGDPGGLYRSRSSIR